MTNDTVELPVGDLLPHSSPMVLLTKICGFEENALSAQVDITSGGKFWDYQSQSVPAWVGMEYMAQAIAALAGIKAKHEDRAVRLGFLLGTRKYKIIHPEFNAGDRLRIDVRQLYKDESGMASFECSICCNKRLAVEAKLNVFEPDEANKILNVDAKK